jgi:hypothetical protein
MLALNKMGEGSESAQASALLWLNLSGRLFGNRNNLKPGIGMESASRTLTHSYLG